MPRYAVIDVGTNSVKFHIGEKHADGTWTTVADRSDVTSRPRKNPRSR